MSKPFNADRRSFLTSGLKWGGGLTALVGSPGLAEMCGITVPQQEGPYYPEGDLNRDNDLATVKPGGVTAKGNVVYVVGKVQDKDCNPIEGALVEVWQACHSGKYNHSEDPNNLELDPNFQYWGRATTDAQGNYKFRTIIPGYYPTSPPTYRPPHIHFKAHAPGHLSLTTQMYFNPATFSDPATAKFVKYWNDREKVPAPLIISFSPTREGKTGTFDIVLRKQP